MRHRPHRPARSRSILHVVLMLAWTTGPTSTSAAAPDLHAQVVEANSLARAGRYEAALVIYRRALDMPADQGELNDRAGLLGNIGHCLEQLGRPRDAVDAFNSALDAAQDDATRAVLTRLIDRIERTKLGRLTVECDAVPAAVSLLDHEARGCPTTIGRLIPGSLTVSATAADGAEAEAEVLIQPGATAHVALRFPGRLLIGGAPGARVHVDGEARCTTPCETVVDAEIAHLLVVELDGQRWQHRLSLEPASRVHIEPRFDNDTWLWVGLGIGAAAVTGTIIGFALADTSDPAPRVRLTTLRPE